VIEDILKQKYGDSLDQLWIKENNFGLVLSAIVINAQARNSGIGSKIMDELVEYSEKNNKIIALTPSNSYGGSKGRLESFYKSFGFTANKGGNKDFRFMETMIRYPKIMNEDKIQGGFADKKSIEDIAKKHNTTVDAIKKAIDKGAKVEMEHTNDKKVAQEIASDHIYEFLHYYDELKKMEDKMKKVEESTKTIIKTFLKEDVKSFIIDESPDTISVLIKYNDRNAGIIYVTPANTEDTMEIVGVKFKKDYDSQFIMGEAIKSLWGLFKDKKSFIVSPELEGVEKWNKFGFSRISPNYLIANRGH